MSRSEGFTAGALQVSFHPNIAKKYEGEEDEKPIHALHLNEGGEKVAHIAWTEHATGLPYVEMLAVAPSHRGRGLTSRLYEEMHTRTGRPALHYEAEQYDDGGMQAAKAHAKQHPEMHRWLSYEKGKPVVR